MQEVPNPFSRIDAEFGSASASVMLLLIGICNAWDIVTHIATETGKREARQPAEKAEMGGPSKRP